MRYGVTLPNGRACGDIHLLVELACLAEAAGWDGVFLEDYIVHQGDGAIPTCDPWVALAAIAVQTTHIRLGTSVTPVPRWVGSVAFSGLVRGSKGIESPFPRRRSGMIPG